MSKVNEELLERLSKRSVGIRVYWLPDTVNELTKICEDTGATFSQVCNAAMKEALKNKIKIAEDALGALDKKAYGKAKNF